MITSIDEIAADEKDAVAEARIGGDRLGGDQEQPRRPDLQPHGIDQPRQDLRQHHAQGDLRGRRAERLRLDDCSRGMSPTRSAMSRMSFSDVPMTISVIFEASPRPMTMKRIGSSASGGTIDRTETTGPSVAPATGSIPMTMPTTSAIAVEIASPVTKRVRLAVVSAQSR